MIVVAFHAKQLHLAPVNLTFLRQQRLNSTCSRLNERRLPMWDRFWISEKHRYIYCCTPKVACSSWKLTMMRLPGEDLSKVRNTNDPAMVRRVFKRPMKYSLAQRQSLLENYYTFMFVREPLERLVSAYRNKCLRDRYYMSWLPRAIRKRVRSANSRRTGKQSRTDKNFCSHIQCGSRHHDSQHDW